SRWWCGISCKSQTAAHTVRGSMPRAKASFAVAFSPGNSSDDAITPAFADPNSSWIRAQKCDSLMYRPLRKKCADKLGRKPLAIVEGLRPSSKLLNVSQTD